jgi:LPXTG-site transpeptidase (sortase) family protein
MELENKKLGIFSKKGLKKFLKPFILLFLVNFLIINRNDISWLFNYRIISGAAGKFIEILENKRDFTQEFKNQNYSTKENTLEISKIGVKAPLIVAENKNEDFNEELNRGVVIFPDSALPGETGQTIVLGHSAPSNWPIINYDGVFSRITELEEKDEIIIYFNNEKYIYYVDKKIFLEKGEEIPNNLKDADNALLLISCWPPGKNIQRIIIKSKLIKI